MDFHYVDKDEILQVCNTQKLGKLILNIKIDLTKTEYANAETEGFWRWCITLSITGVLNFVHRPEL
jgi:hypothetical protein